MKHVLETILIFAIFIIVTIGENVFGQQTRLDPVFVRSIERAEPEYLSGFI